MNFLIVDLESTCDDEQPDYQHEIIEVGAVVLDSGFCEIASFQSFVRPLINPTLTQFCTSLTGISQDHVQSASPFSAVWVSLLEFASEHNVSSWGSWGKSDFNLFVRQAEASQSVIPYWFANHTNLKKDFIKSRPGKHKQVGLLKACQIAGIDPVTPHHRALSDSRSAAQLLRFFKCT